jgi:NAD(P)-dependent dehydrogenase (short-subunit alcohol dehydrogenase family)
MRFKDKIAIVTGGASGIGKEVATRFVAEGGSVVINGRNMAKAEAAAREIDPTGKRVAVHAGDIALPATSDAVVKTAIGQFGRVDVLFNNAGIFAPKPFLEINEVEYDRFLDIILKGKFFAAINRPISGATHQKELPGGRQPFQEFRCVKCSPTEGKLMLHTTPAGPRRSAAKPPR